MALADTTTGVGARLEAYLGRHSHKLWDWDAFPDNRGYPELSRAQMRYIGAGGSPKVGDPSTLSPTCFTCSLIYLDSPRYAAVHSHEIEEVFWVHEGRLTVTWEHASGDLVDVMLGPGDAIFNLPEVAHGFRNEGPQPVTAQFMVGHPKPLKPTYKYHPRQGDKGPEFGRPLLPPSDPRAQWIEQYICRARDAATRWVELPGGRLAHQPYVLPREQGGLVEPGHYSLEMLYLYPGLRSPWYRYDFEVAFLVWDGVLGVEWTDGGQDAATARLSRRDLVQVPAGQRFRLVHDGPLATRAAAMLGTPSPPPERWTSETRGPAK